MKSRPLSVSIISWILIVAGLLSLVASLLTMNNPNVKVMMENNPLPMSVQYALMYVGLAILIISGFGMLKGKNWARLLYVAWGVFSIALNVITTPKLTTMMIPGMVFLAIVIFFLFLPKSNAFFSGKE